MSGRKNPLTEKCGGQFAFVAGDLSGGSGLSHGAVRLFLELCGRADMNGHGNFRLKDYAAEIGNSCRHVQRWKRELEERGCLEQRNNWDNPIANFRVERNPDRWTSIALKNAPRLAKRRIAKARRATSTSQSRDEGVAGITTSHDLDSRSSLKGLRSVGALVNQLKLGRKKR